jgi:hypothetical protein
MTREEQVEFWNQFLPELERHAKRSMRIYSMGPNSRGIDETTVLEDIRVMKVLKEKLESIESEYMTKEFIEDCLTRPADVYCAYTGATLKSLTNVGTEMMRIICTKK